MTSACATRRTRSFVELGRPPRADEVADVEHCIAAAVEEGWHRLYAAHALVLHASGDIRMANPFSAVPTAYRVRATGRWWFANCAWDALGICAALHVDGDIASSCPDCGEELRVDTRPAALRLVAAVPRPRPRSRLEEHLDRWLSRRSPGATISVTKLSELAHSWWDDRLSPTWRPHRREQNQAILERLELTGEFWRLG